MKQEKNIWEQSRVELFQKLDCRETGLSQEDAADRLAKYGANELHAGKQKSVLQIFLGQFADFLVLILILAAVISACMGDVESMIVILAVITMNAILGTVQTVKASASLDSLKQMSAPTAKVLRDGQIVQIPGREVVPGDVVILEAGDSVCADGRLLECASLKCAESALTGESLPVEKDTELLSGETALGDRKNMVFSGSFVTYGRGRFLVTATGMDTEMGKIAQLLKNTEERKTPLQVSLDQFGRKLSIIILVICAVLFGFHQRGIVFRIYPKSRRGSRALGCFQMGNTVNLRIIQFHRIIMYPVRLIRINLINDNRLLLPRSIYLGRDLRIHVSFIDKEPPQLIRRLLHQCSIQNNRRLPNPTELLAKPTFFIPARPVINKKLPFHQPEHFKVRLLSEIWLQLICSIRFIIGDNLYFIQQIFTVTDIFRRTTGGQYPNKAYEI